MARKTPQEKKRDSYEKDRRNTYGESGARSRFAIARARRNRASRRRAALRQAIAAGQDPELAERLEGRAVAKFGGRWQKWSDDPLGHVLLWKLKRRSKEGGLPVEVQETKVKRIGRLTNRCN